MRPKSIVRFEQLYWASIVVSLIATVIGLEAMTRELASDLAGVGLGTGFVIGLVAVGMAISVLLWWLIARKASNVAKWILVVLTAIGLLSVSGSLMGSLDATTILGLASYALTIAAIVCLFRDDAKAWFAGGHGPDPA